MTSLVQSYSEISNMTSLVLEILSPPSGAGPTGRPLCPLGFYIDAEDLKSGPHT